MGLSLSGFGVFFLIHHDETEFVTGSYTVGGSVALIVGGVFTIVIAILGIVAAAGELYPLLIAVSGHTHKHKQISSLLYTYKYLVKNDFLVFITLSSLTHLSYLYVTIPNVTIYLIVFMTHR